MFLGSATNKKYFFQFLVSSINVAVCIINGETVPNNDFPAQVNDRSFVEISSDSIIQFIEWGKRELYRKFNTWKISITTIFFVKCVNTEISNDL